MRDPISGPQDLVFLAISFIVMLIVAVNPQRVFAVLNAFSHAKPPSDAVFTAIRFIAGFCAVGTVVLLLVHFLRGH